MSDPIPTTVSDPKWHDDLTWKRNTHTLQYHTDKNTNISTRPNPMNQNTFQVCTPFFVFTTKDSIENKKFTADELLIGFFRLFIA
jgi:hypothetical protein